jgi:DNA-binding NarL/FixJ family response regulator
MTTKTEELAPNDALRAVVALRELADRLEEEHVVRAIELGWPWARIAEALNVTRQAVHKKHAPRLRALGISTGGRDV